MVAICSVQFEKEKMGAPAQREPSLALLDVLFKCPFLSIHSANRGRGVPSFLTKKTFKPLPLSVFLVFSLCHIVFVSISSADFPGIDEWTTQHQHRFQSLPGLHFIPHLAAARFFSLAVQTALFPERINHFLHSAQLGASVPTDRVTSASSLPARKVASCKVLDRAEKWLASEDGDDGLLPDGCLHSRWDEQITSSPALQQCMLSLNELDRPNGETSSEGRVLWNVADRRASRQQCPPSRPELCGLLDMRQPASLQRRV